MLWQVSRLQQIVSLTSTPLASLRAESSESSHPNSVHRSTTNRRGTIHVSDNATQQSNNKYQLLGNIYNYTIASSWYSQHRQVHSIYTQIRYASNFSRRKCTSLFCYVKYKLNKSQGKEQSFNESWEKAAGGTLQMRQYRKGMPVICMNILSHYETAYIHAGLLSHEIAAPCSLRSLVEPDSHTKSGGESLVSHILSWC